MPKDLFSIRRWLKEAAAIGTGLGLVLLQLTGVMIPIRVALAAAPTCNGIEATIYVEEGKIVGGVQDGQNYAGTLNGTAGDVIVGTSGNDIINGNTICGGDGNDTLNGRNDEDLIIGGGGNDVISGGGGTDALDGGPGDDRLLGGEDDDIFNGGAGNDFCEEDGGMPAQSCEAGSGEGIVIIKQNAVPNDGQNFTFSGTNGLGDFSLDNDDDATLSDTKVFTHVDTREYMVSETALPSGWTLTDIECSSGVSESLTDKKVSFTLDEGEIVSCTFTNTSSTSYECNDGEDNDDDGLVDLNDSGCENAQDDDETGGIDETQCNDGEDNDNDKKVDAKDPGCWTNAAKPSSYNPEDNSESNPTVSCPTENGTVTFHDVRAGFMTRLKLQNPEAYARIVARLEGRRAHLANLCVKHPLIYQKIIARREAIVAKHTEQRERILEKWEKKGDHGQKNHAEKKGKKNKDY